MKRRIWSVCAICMAAVIIALHYFPVFRVIQLADSSYYNRDEVGMFVYIGSRSDSEIAMDVIDMADSAFSDISHTREEKEAAYGILGRYALTADRGAVRETHDIDMLSAHFDDTIGYIWVRYSNEAYDAQGKLVCGSIDIMSLWYLEKDDSGEWNVISIKEEP